VHKATQSVVGIFISLVPRAQFSYDQSGWEQILDEILADFEKDIESNFVIVNTEAAAKAVS
jgi:hypothetical protein